MINENFEPLSKEAINALPIIQYTGRVVLVEDLADVAAACELLSKESLLGFDTETRPVFKKGEHHQTSLLQLAGEDVVVLIRINKVPFDACLASFFADDNIIKAGVAVRDDVKALQSLYTFQLANIVDLGEMARELGLKTHGLRTLTASLFGKRLCKASRCSNWDKDSLTPQQIRYAATDAWMSRQIYKRLINCTKM